jgi:hypothetical protein
MLKFIIIITVIVILLINFTVDFIKNRQLFKKKNTLNENLLKQNFYDKYNKQPVVFQKESLINYEPLKAINNLVINSHKKIFIINGYISLINSIIRNNNFLINNNLLIARQEIINNNTVENNKKTKKFSKKKSLELENIDNITINLQIKDIDWKKIIFQKNYKTIKLSRIIDIYFTNINNNEINVNIHQEYLLNNQNHYIETILTFNNQYKLMTKINNVDIFNDSNFSNFNKFYSINTDINNLNIVQTVLSIISCLENQQKSNILMIKNIHSEFYNKLINYSNFNGHIIDIESLSIDNIFDNIYRCYITFKVKNINKKNNQQDIQLMEQYIDFECLNYNFPQLVNFHHNK